MFSPIGERPSPSHPQQQICSGRKVMKIFFYREILSRKFFVTPFFPHIQCSGYKNKGKKKKRPPSWDSHMNTTRALLRVSVPFLTKEDLFDERKGRLIKALFFGKMTSLRRKGGSQLSVSASVPGTCVRVLWSVDDARGRWTSTTPSEK